MLARFHLISCNSSSELLGILEWLKDAPTLFQQVKHRSFVKQKNKSNEIMSLHITLHETESLSGIDMSGWQSGMQHFLVLSFMLYNNAMAHVSHESYLFLLCSCITKSCVWCSVFIPPPPLNPKFPTILGIWSSRSQENAQRGYFLNSSKLSKSVKNRKTRSQTSKETMFGGSKTFEKMKTQKHVKTLMWRLPLSCF